jgi:hypothetical protein
VPGDFSFWAADSPVTVTFLSVFKWEDRKNWRQLLRAFMYMFAFRPSVGLFIKTSTYMGADPDGESMEFMESVLEDIVVRRPPNPPAPKRANMYRIQGGMQGGF